MTEERDKKKDYWTEETEKAVRDFLMIDVTHLEERLNKLIKLKQKKGWTEVQIQEDGNIAEIRSKMIYADNPAIIQQKKEIFELYIKKPLNRLVESIIFNYKLFRYDIDLKTLHNDCMSFLFINSILRKKKNLFHILELLQKDICKTEKNKLILLKVLI